MTEPGHRQCRPRLPLAGAFLNRLGHRRGDVEWVARIAVSETSLYLPVQGPDNLVRPGDPPRPVMLAREAALALAGADAQPVLLGRAGETHYFAVPVAAGAEPPAGAEFRGLRALAHALPADELALLSYARAMVLWHLRHRYCPRCGHPTAPRDAGHARACTNECCGKVQFPRTDPAVIVLVARGDRALLGRQADWPEGRYSTIAGFVEPGESLEEAVAREVMEETGVSVGGVSYYASQPWPFPGSLMLGFRAEATSEAIDLKDGELEEARWISREDIRAGRAGIPTRMSIAYALVRDWFDEEPGASLDAEIEPGSWHRPKESY